jgi:TonB family protein
MRMFKNAGLTLLLASASFLAINASADPMIVPVVDVSPEYPQSALHRDTAGYVTVRFDLDEDGRAKNISVVEAMPDRTFRASALNALRRSSFQALDSEGQALSGVVESVERTYRFSVENVERTYRLSSDARAIGMN